MNTRGQIWVETVIYTLVGLALIGLVLAIVTPRINEFRDRAVIDQTIDSLNVFDKKINEVLSAPGNVRVVDFRMRRGELYFNTTGDKIEFIMDDSRALFSEPDLIISVGRLNVLTTEGSKRHTILLTLNSAHNFTFDGIDSDDLVKFSSTSVPYRFSIKNSGSGETPGVFNIDFSEIS